MVSEVDSTPAVMTSDVGVWTGDDKDYFRINKTEDALLVDADQQSSGVSNKGYDHDDYDERGEENFMKDGESDGKKTENCHDKMDKNGEVKDTLESDEEESDVDTFL